jgi:LuxR family transcriptional regulator, maltose regulon positive regulatory protein
MGMSAAACRAAERRTPGSAHGLSERAVFRTGLVNRLRAARQVPLVVVTAPAGYGKTTLVTDWMGRDDRRFAWCHLDEHDDSVSVVEKLLVAVATLRGSARRPRAQSTAALQRGLRSLEEVVIVLDGIDLVTDPDCAPLLSACADALAAGTQLALVGRGEPPLPLPRLRAHGELLELDLHDLRFSDREASALLRSTSVELPPHAVPELNERLEGWPLGLRVAASSLQGSADELELLEGYFGAEVLSRLAEEDLVACDAITGASGSAAVLERLDRANVFMLPLDRERRCYRLHPAFRAVLLAQLERHEPESVVGLRTRAADWHREQGDLDAALGYAHAAHDRERLADLVGLSVLPLSSCVPADVAALWLAEIDDEALLERRPAAAAVGALTHAASGRTGAAGRWAAATHDRTWSALVRALLGGDGPGRRADAEEALAGLMTGSPWRVPALLALAEAMRLEGALQAADDVLAEAGEEAAASGRPALQAVALALRSLLASTTRAWDRARSLAERASSVVHDAGLEGDVSSACASVAEARVALRDGDHGAARRAVAPADAARLPASPMAWLELEVNLELADIDLALGDLGLAFAALDAADGILARHPQHPAFTQRTLDLRARATALSHSGERTALTPAELRLLPLLTTHLSFQEIAQELYLSRNTVKSQAISIYRKLGVSARGQAIERAAAVGLAGTTVGAREA